MDKNHTSKKLFDAISNGKSEEAKEIIANTKEPEELNELVSGESKLKITPLQNAIQSGNVEIVNDLLEKGVDINKKDSRGNIALNHATLVIKYIERDIRTNRSEDTVMLNYISIFNNILEKTGNDDVIDIANDTGINPFHSAMQLENVEIAKAILEKYPMLLDEEDGNNLTPLSWAIQSNNTKMARVLIEKGANVGHKFYTGHLYETTPLICALMSGEKDIAKLLIEKGADVTLSDSKKKTPLKLAKEKGYTDIVKIIKDKTGKAHTGTSKFSLFGGNSEGKENMGANKVDTEVVVNPMIPKK